MFLITEPDDPILNTPTEICHMMPTIDTIVNMKRIMKANRGIGLAANQVGIGQRFFIAEFSDGFEVCINPVIVNNGKEVITSPEGCLSILKNGVSIYQEKDRWAIVDLEYTQMDKRRVTKTFKRKDAKIVQHEMDHLEGRLCIENWRELV